MRSLARLFLMLIAGGTFLVSASAQSQPVALDLKTSVPFHFVGFGDTRFHDPADTKSANPEIRHALVAAIAQENPAFISIGGDIVLDVTAPRTGKCGTRKPRSGGSARFLYIPRLAITICTAI